MSRPLNIIMVQTITPEQLQYEQENSSLSYQNRDTLSLEDLNDTVAPWIIISPSVSATALVTDINTATPAPLISVTVVPRNINATTNPPSASDYTNLLPNPVFKTTGSRSVVSWDPDGSTSGLAFIEREVARQERQINSCIQDLQPDPLNTVSSVVSGITTVNRISSPSLDIS